LSLADGLADDLLGRAHRPAGCRVAIRQQKGRKGYLVEVYAGIDPITGRQRYKTGRAAKKREAERLEARLRTEVAQGRHRGTAARNMSELLDIWLAWRATNGRPISPHTLNDYRGLVERKLKPGLGKLRVAQCDTLVLDRFYMSLRQGGNARTKGGPLSASRIHDVHAILSGALGLAVRYGWIAFNPARLTTPPAAAGETRAVPTPAQVRAALAATAETDPEFHLFLRLCATTGLRPGEVCALRWLDLDLEAGELTVSGNIVHAKGLERGYIRKKPKSRRGERVLALDPHTLELLRARRARQQTRARESGGELGEDAYVFSRDEAGRQPVRRDRMTRRFSALAAELGHGYTLYGLRHFVATQLGAVSEIATVRERMGHGSLEITGAYIHSVSEADRAAAAHMGDLLDGDRRSPRRGQASSE
jgi:integrase